MWKDTYIEKIGERGKEYVVILLYIQVKKDKEEVYL